jgi:general L-amino acid transport system permease protein
MVAGSEAALPVERPPRSEIGVIGWLHANLFSSWSNTLLTLLGLYITYYALSGVVEWGLLRATFSGADGGACTRPAAGACWPYVTAKFAQFMYGRFPDEERWRVDLVYLLALAGLIPLLIPALPGKFWNAVYVFAVLPVLAFFLLVGGSFGLAKVDTSLWGGLLVTLVVSTVGISGSFPIGIALALGRRSRMPIVRWVSVGFIEFVRGVPLITVLFMASVMLPLFLPPGVTFDKLLRALIGVALFDAAYLAETVRGGLQAIPRGQFEAADALGLSYTKKMGLIVLPQALKLVVPGIVGNFIGLFKNTSLVTIIGLFDLLGIVQLNNADQKWFSPTTAMTGYVFAGIVFWIFCYCMSRYSQMIEKRLATGDRR